jgi:hypothetical protein
MNLKALDGLTWVQKWVTILPGVQQWCWVLVKNPMPEIMARLEQAKRDAETRRFADATELEEALALGFGSVDACRKHQAWLDRQKADKAEIEKAGV